MSRKILLALAGAATLLGGCATYDPYYDGNYAYDNRYYERPAYRYYDYGPAYYPRYYAPAPAPSVSFGLGYSSGWRRY